METSVAILKNPGTLPETRVNSILAEFGDACTKASEWVEEARNFTVVDENDTDSMAIAKDRAKEMKKKRLFLADTHKRLKADALAEGTFLDYVKRTLTGLVEEAEVLYDQRARFKEIKEQERKATVAAERMNALSMYSQYMSENALTFNVDTISAMSDDIWVIYLEGICAKSKKWAIEKEEAAKFSAMLDEAGSMNREYDKKIAKELAEKLAAANKKVEVVTEKLEKVKEEKKEEKKEERRIANSPDKDKLLEWAKRIETVSFPGGLTTAKGEQIFSGACDLLKKTAAYVRKNAELIKE